MQVTTPSSHLEAILNQGIAHYRQHRLPEAEDCAREVIAAEAGHPGALQLLGLIALDSGYPEESLGLLQKAQAAQPNDPLIQISLSNCLIQLKRLPEALAQIEHALVLAPDQLIALNLAGILYQETQQPDKAASMFNRALALQPGSAELQYNLAVLLQKQGKYKEALHSSAKLLQIQPEHLEALNNRGVIYQELGELDKAQRDFSAVLTRKPDHGEAHFNLGVLKILRAQLPEGWDDYEWRWDCPAMERKTYGLPRWQGQALSESQRLLVHADAGFGDSLQFVRYLLTPDCPQPLVLLCQDALVPLLRVQNWPFEIVSDLAPLPEGLAYEFPLLSFPALRRTTPATIPLAGPYLSAPVAGPRLPQQSADYRLRVGFVWAGSPDNAIDLKRSCQLKHFFKLMRQSEDVYWVSLQKGKRLDEAGELPPANAWDAAPLLHDFGDTAALVAQLDLVIAVDTSVVHLAAAMGRPTWVLLPMIPDWRWFLDRDDSPWYGCVRLFRQPERNGWKQVFRQVERALASFRV